MRMCGSCRSRADGRARPLPASTRGVSVKPLRVSLIVGFSLLAPAGGLCDRFTRPAAPAAAPGLPRDRESGPRARDAGARPDDGPGRADPRPEAVLEDELDEDVEPQYAATGLPG